MSIPDICWEPLTWVSDSAFNQRRIVSAANRYTLKTGGQLVVPSVRHYSREHAPIMDLLLPHLESRFVVEPNQGFVDQYSNYWTREQAMIIATHAGQVRKDRGGPEEMLFSEDLY